MSHNQRLRKLGVLVGGLVFFFLLSWPSLPRTELAGYFDFADQRSWGPIPNGWNVLSNLALLYVGGWGFLVSRKLRDNPLRFHSQIFFAAVFVTGFGSSYFHWNPSPESLVWDRVWMSVAFAAATSLLIKDRVDFKWDRPLFFGLLGFGILSVLMACYGRDVRAYIVTQFGFLMLIVGVVRFYPPGQIQKKYLGVSVLLYAAAKILELYDRDIYDTLGLISGHSLKHLISACAVVPMVKAIEETKKRPIEKATDPA